LELFCLLLKLLGDSVIDAVLLEEVPYYTPLEARVIIVLNVYDTP
jgi:hypothetical protein